MIKFFRILDLIVSLVLVALGVAIYFITKKWWTIIVVSTTYIVWEIILFKKFFKIRKISNETCNYDCESASETDEEEEE